MDQSEFQRRQGEIYSDLASAVIYSLPQDWDSAQLRLGPPEDEGGYESLSHELVNPTLRSGLVTAMPNDEVYDHTGRLVSLFREHGRLWSKATFEIEWDQDQKQWRFAMDYEYNNA
jgi:hypothetical protein